MQSEESIEIDRGVLGRVARLRNCDLSPQIVVVFVPERHDHRDPIGCPALKDGDHDGMILTASGILLGQRGAH